MEKYKALIRALLAVPLTHPQLEAILRDPMAIEAIIEALREHNTPWGDEMALQIERIANAN